MLRLNSDLIQYLPDWFREIIDYQEICKTESEKFSALADEINAVAENYFFQTMDTHAVEQWEQIFNIVANPLTEDLEFRRGRVLNRISLNTPFTLAFLYQKLDQFIGEGNWRVEVDYANYTLYIFSSAENQKWASEVSYTVNKIKPAHIVFTNSPIINAGIVLDETVSLAKREWNYKLGIWKLGLKPFVTFGEKEVIAMPSQTKIEPELLNDTAAAIADNVASARINGTITISEVTKSSSVNITTITYTVTPEMTKVVTKVELLDSDKNVLTTSPVYVPLATEPILLTHEITTEEATV